MKGKSVNLAGMYAKAQELSETESQIQKLQAEVERLRASSNPELEAQLDQLRSSLASTNGVQEFSLDAIRPNPEQPRKTFATESIRGMALSLTKDGQLTPVILMSAVDTPDLFDLFDGERRWRAARELGWKTIQGITMPRPSDLHRKALLTTLHREDLNPLDKAEALLKEITSQTEIGADDITRILSTVIKRLERQKKTGKLSLLIGASDEETCAALTSLEVNDQERKILLVLLGLGLNPASVLSNDFRVLSLFPDLKEAIQNSNLKSAHALVLQRLSPSKLKKTDAAAAKIRGKATEDVLTKDLSVSETKELVGTLIEKHAPKTPEAIALLRTGAVVKGLKKLVVSKIDRNELQLFRTELMTKLAEIDTELGGSGS